MPQAVPRGCEVEELKEFRIIIRRSIEIHADQFWEFGSKDETRNESIEEIVENHPSLALEPEDESRETRYRVNMMKLLEADAESDENFDPIVTRLKRCATCFYLDEATDTLYLDYSSTKPPSMRFERTSTLNP